MKSRCICILLVGLLFPLQAIGQKVTVQTIKSPQAFAAMQGRNGEIVQSLPGERVIEKEVTNGKTSLYYLQRSGERTKIYEGVSADYFTRSRTGERICFSAGDGFIVKDLTSQQEFKINSADAAYVKGFGNISPDGSQVVFDEAPRAHAANQSLSDYLVVTRDLATGKERLIANGGYPKWSSTSQQIVFDVSKGPPSQRTLYLCVCNSNGAETRTLNSSINMGGWHKAWSPDGKYIMDLDRAGDLRIVDVVKDVAVAIPPSRLGTVPNCRKWFHSTEWSPDGKSILVHVAIDSEITEVLAGWELFLVSVDGSTIEKLEVPELGMQTPIWLSNDTFLYCNRKMGIGWKEVTIRRIGQ